MWPPYPLHVIDFEGHVSYGVVEWGVATLTGGQLCAAETGLCLAERAIPFEDQRVHGLDTDSTAGAPPFREDYASWVTRRRGGLFCAHNAGVEHRLLKSAWACPPLVPDWGRPGQTCASWGPWLDTVALARAVWPQLESHALGNLITDLGLEGRLNDWTRAHCPPDRHRPHCALYDALAAAAVLVEAAAEFKRRGATCLLSAAGVLDPQPTLGL